jgi:hypothetical protein
MIDDATTQANAMAQQPTQQHILAATTSDRDTVKDSLGFTPYVDAIAEFFPASKRTRQKTEGATPWITEKRKRRWPGAASGVWRPLTCRFVA